MNYVDTTYILSMKKIAFFGASITQQSGQNGYFFHLKNMLQDRSPAINIFQFGYGSNCLDDAGFYFLDKVLAVSPDIIFIEYFTTFQIKFDKKYLVILNDLLNKNITPINLILPTIHNLGGSYCINQAYDAENNYNVPVLDIRKYVDKNYCVDDKFLRDGVHTTAKGGKYYAEKIIEYLDGNDIFTRGFESFKFHNFDVSDIKKYFDKYMFSTQSILTKTGIHMFFDRPAAFLFDDQLYLEIFANLRIGPNTNSVGVIFNSVLIGETILSDRWTYYERYCLKPLFSSRLNIDYDRVYGLKSLDLPIDLIKDNNCLTFIPWVSPNCEYVHANKQRPTIDFLGELFSNFPIKTVEAISDSDFIDASNKINIHFNCCQDLKSDELFYKKNNNKLSNFHLGDKLFFHKEFGIEKFLLNGWSVQESEHRWTDGDSASLRLHLIDSVIQNMILRLECSPYLASPSGRLDHQSVEVYVNRKLVATWIVSVKDWYEAFIPNNIVEDGTLEIMLTISHPNSPLDCKVSDDLRKLGIRCFSLELNAPEIISS